MCCPQTQALQPQTRATFSCTGNFTFQESPQGRDTVFSCPIWMPSRNTKAVR